MVSRTMRMTLPCMHAHKPVGLVDAASTLYMVPFSVRSHVFGPMVIFRFNNITDMLILSTW